VCLCVCVCVCLCVSCRDAWDVMPYHLQTKSAARMGDRGRGDGSVDGRAAGAATGTAAAASIVSVAVVERGPLGSVVGVHFTVNPAAGSPSAESSWIRQRIVVTAGSPLVQFEGVADGTHWQAAEGGVPCEHRRHRRVCPVRR
jgi:hypothetical protein